MLYRAEAFEPLTDEEWQDGRGRYSLWTGDAGVAVFAADCLEARAGFPIMDAA